VQSDTVKFSRSFLFLFTALILLVIAFLKPASDKPSGQKKIAENFEKVYHKKITETRSLLRQVAESFQDSLKWQQKINDLNTSFRAHDIGVFIYKGKELKYWSDNQVEPPGEKSDGLLKQNTGWYHLESYASDGITVKALIHLKREYPYRNEYLKDRFAKGFDIPYYVLIQDAKGSGEPVHGIESRDVLHLKFPAISDYSAHFPFILVCALILLILFVLSSESFLTKRAALLDSSLLTLAFVLIRWLHFPSAEFESELFNPVIYSNSNLFSSMGMLVIDVMISILLCITLLRAFNFFGWSAAYLLNLLVSFYTIFIPWLACSLIRDSSIHYELAELLSLNRYSVTGLILLFCLIIFFLSLLKKSAELSKEKVVLPALFILLLPAAITLIFFNDLLLYVFVLALSGFFIVFLSDRLPNSSEFIKTLFFIFILSIPLTYIMEKENDHKHYSLLRSEAESLSSARDPVLEFLFADLSHQIEKDERLKSTILDKNISRDDVMLMLRHRYFKGYWNKFDLNFSSYDTICNVVHKGSGKDDLPLYEQIINDEAFQVDDNLFYHQDLTTGRSFYLGKIDISVNGSFCGVLYLEFNPVYFPEQPGYPELLLNKKKGETEVNFSWARYQNNHLLAASGNFSYPLIYNADTLVKDTIFRKNGYYNFIKEAPNQLVITTKKEDSLLQKASIFSFFFLFTVILYLIGFMLLADFRSIDLKTGTYRTRLYASFFILTFFGLSLAAFATYYFIRQQDKLKNRELISDKMNSALTQLKDVSDALMKLDPVLNPFLDVRIDKIANSIRSDINLYDLNGTLLASSTPAIFDEKLLGRKMNPTAYRIMSSNSTSVYLQQEEIGRLNYLSGYMPLTTPQGVVLGYLNLPYFAGEKDLKQDINSIVQALMNIYLILFILAMGLAGLISTRLSEPLKLLQGKLSALNLGKNNELLEWNRKDEIGDLITQYNKMVVQLAESAERLAMSERESAWKEMAKQVAHEIKNPLTPMKLGVQHLQKAVQEKAPDLEQRIERFTRNMVEQIDTLSRISSEFSDFARLPEPVKEHLDLTELASGVIETFKNDSSYEISFTSPENSIYINGDRNQILRVINNLLKNSIQAIPDDRKGSIKVDLKRDADTVILSVSDNGVGIPEEIGERIFTPKFTTKSGGMGLGLAMVRSIVESHDGTITFSSVPDEGTTFFITLPTIK
jgi:two-component system, NtrC family, nitrogen regulation sensor histidine kinase NtrY